MLNTSLISALAILTLTTGILLYFPAEDGDIWWHIAVGKEIVENGAIPQTDSWTFTADGHESYYHSWLSAVLFFFIWGLTGDIGILICKYAVHLTTCFLAFYTARRWLSVPYSVCILFFTAYWLSTISVRPDIFNPLFTLLLFSILTKSNDVKMDAAGVVSLGLWANLQGGFIIGLILWCVCHFVKICFSIISKSSVKTILYYAGILLIGIFVTLINPYGMQIFTIILEGSNHPTADWENMRFFAGLNVDVITLYVFIGSVLILLATVPMAESLEDLLLLSCGFVCLGIAYTAVRLNWLLVLPSITSLYSVRYIGLRKAPADEPPNNIELFYDNISLKHYILIGSVFGFLWFQKIDYQQWHTHRLPLSFFNGVDVEEMRGRIFCPLVWSGRVTLLTNGKVKTYIDGRMFLYPYLFFRDYLHILSYQGLTEHQIKAYQINYLLLPVGSVPHFSASSIPLQWDVLHQDDSAVLMKRKDT